MKRKEELAFIAAGVFAFLFLLLIILVKTVDVQAVGPEGTSVGFATINSAIHDVTGFRSGFYTVSKVLGILELALVVLWAGYGVYMWIRKKSILKVPSVILSAGIIYAAVAVLYVFFEKVVINYRPIIMEGKEDVEASFPSTHTLIACVVLGTSIVIVSRIIKNKMAKSLIQALFAIMMIATVVGRLVSGVHWFTDIIGGLLLSASLICVYLGLTRVFQSLKKNHYKKERQERRES